MSMEGPPMPEKVEREPITDEQCLEAMKALDYEKVREWYADQEKSADQDPSGKGRINLTIKMGEMQLEAGFADEARETLEAAQMDADGQRDDESLDRIQAILDKMQ